MPVPSGSRGDTVAECDGRMLEAMGFDEECYVGTFESRKCILYRPTEEKLIPLTCSWTFQAVKEAEH
jgi:hypothetical protein